MFHTNGHEEHCGDGIANCSTQQMVRCGEILVGDHRFILVLNAERCLNLVVLATTSIALVPLLAFVGCEVLSADIEATLCGLS